MTIADPWNIDPTSPISNSSFNSVNVAEGMQPSLVNNAMRQLASFFAQTTSYKSADLSTSVSTNIAATGTGLYMDLTGANAVNHFGSPAGAEQPNAAVFRFLQYDSSASVSHGANIKLIGSVSRKMQPGDVQGVIHEGSGVWREFCFASASGNLPMDSLSVTTITNRSMSTSAISVVTLNAASISVTNQVFNTLNATSISTSVINSIDYRIGGASISHGIAQVVRDTNAVYTVLGTIMPNDNTIPQITEGDEVLSVSITPKRSTSDLRIRVSLNVTHGSAGGEICAAIFVDATANAIKAAAIGGTNSATMETLTFEHVVAAGSTAARTYSVRAGSATATDAYLNGDATARIFGGVAISTLEVEEILAQ